MPEICEGGRDSTGARCLHDAGHEYEGIAWCRYCWPPRVAAKHCYDDHSDPTELEPDARESYQTMLRLFGERFWHEHYCGSCREDWGCDADDCDYAGDKECPWCGDYDGDPDERPF